MGVADDAAVYRVNRETAIVSTVDFFAPLVDDPWTYGAIAAANAMSDVYAMGGEVVFALNVAAFPEHLPPAVVTAILRGAAEKVAEAGAVIAGGHTIWDEEPKFGLAVTGIAKPARLFRKSGLKPGDRLYLTKPLGTGALLSGIKSGAASGSALEPAVASMTELNRHAAHLCHEAGIRAATDVTGFGLLGHLWEMADRSGVACAVQAGNLPALPGVLEAFASHVHTGGEGRNRAWLEGRVTVSAGVAEGREALAYDPQTSGGLLIGASPRRARKLEQAFARDGLALWQIGSVAAGAPRITVA
jgi:selenide,water dikinase